MSVQALAFVLPSWYCFVMAKHIAPPATSEQIMRALGVTREDREIIDRVLKEVDEEEEAMSPKSHTIQRSDSVLAKKEPKC
jgi:hypothetical protein